MHVCIHICEHTSVIYPALPDPLEKWLKPLKTPFLDLVACKFEMEWRILVEYIKDYSLPVLSQFC